MDEITKRYLLTFREQPNDILVQQEVLSKPDNSKKPVRDQKFYELRINDWTESWQPGFAVVQCRIQWSEFDQEFIWQDEQAEHWPTLHCPSTILFDLFV